MNYKNYFIIYQLYEKYFKILFGLFYKLVYFYTVNLKQ